ncbi:MAG: hypothetical protein ACNA7J_15060 [Wenzhouxiangella sp.]
MHPFTPLPLFLLLASVVAHADCDGPGTIIDQRSEVQYEQDLERQRARCVVFVLAGPDDRLRQGWVEWHHERSDGNTRSTRLGLYPAGGRANLAFGIVPEGIHAESGATRLTVLLPSSFWLLVNSTRVGWQMRAGLVREADSATIDKLFTDVGLNAGLAEDAGIDGIRQTVESWPFNHH